MGQELPSCRAEVQRTPLTATQEPAGHGATVLVCVGRFAIKCKGRTKIRAGPFKETDNKNLLERDRGWPEEWG